MKIVIVKTPDKKVTKKTAKKTTKSFFKKKRSVAGDNGAAVDRLANQICREIWALQMETEAEALRMCSRLKEIVVLIEEQFNVDSSN